VEIAIPLLTTVHRAVFTQMILLKGKNMKTWGLMNNMYVRMAFVGCLVTVLLTLVGASTVQAQGIVTFDYPWLNNGASFYWRYYDSSGMWIHVVHAPGPQYDDMARIGGGLAEHPNNGTPHMEFTQTPGYFEYVSFSLTNGNSFGLISVDLADPVAPSLAPIDIMFIGLFGDGSTVTNIFTTGGGNSSSFQTYNFISDFASGLLSVSIPSPTWAMDNIVFVPEPGAGSLLVAGLLAIAAHKIRKGRRSAGNRAP
jgi:hypothetical protein